ncbi:hypothetical protein HZA57_05430 [Candidatus Poribacteria bacterium]|nr:hypothetical protein [Candidatus Poribacteria bacterium]
MAQPRITKEELQHDAVLESADLALHKLKEYRYHLAGALGAFLIVYGVIAYVQSSKYNELASANTVLTEAATKFGEAVGSHEWASADRVRLMNEVVTLADKLRTDFEGSPVAHEALFMKGNAYYQAGDDIAAGVGGAGAPNTQRAIDAYAQFVAESETALDRARGYLALGYANENAFFLTNEDSKLNEAMASYEKASKETAAGFFADEALLARARILSGTLNKPEEAIALYRTVMEHRWKPVENMENERNPSRQQLMYVKTMLGQFELANTARNELSRLGVDVDKDYPPVKAAE